METKLNDQGRKNATVTARSALRNTILPAIVAGSMVFMPTSLTTIARDGIFNPSPVASSNVQQDIKNNNHTTGVQQKSNGHMKHAHVNGSVKIGKSEIVRMSPDQRKITYTFTVENKNVAHLLTATCRDKTSGVYYRLEIYFDISIGVVNLNIYNEAAKDAVASGMFFIDTIAKTGDKITLEMAYTRDAEKKDAVELNIRNETKKANTYTTGPISFSISDRFEAFEAEKIVIKEAPKTMKQKPKSKESKPKEMPINPLKEAELHNYLFAMVKG